MEPPEKPYSALKFDCWTLNSEHRFDRGRIGDIGDAAVRFHIGDGSAIQQDVGSGIAAAIGNEVGTGAVDAAGVIDVGDSWRQLDQVQRIPVDEGQIFDISLIDDLAGGGILGLQRGVLRGNLNCLGGSSNFKSHVHGHVGSDIDLDASA